MQGSINVKLVIVGDGAIGKTCVMIRYTESYFNTEYTPTIFDNKSKQISLAGKSVNLNMWDTAGQEEYSRLRPIAYPNTDVFIIAFSVVDPESFINAKKRWYPQVRTEVPSARILFVGTKSDLKSSQYSQNNTKKQLTQAQITKNIQSELQCHYKQCSSLTGEGIDQVFNQAVRIVLVNQGFLKQKNPSVGASRSAPKENQKEKGNAQQGGCYCQLI